MLAVSGGAVLLILAFFVIIVAPLWALSAHLILRWSGETRGGHGRHLLGDLLQLRRQHPDGDPVLGYLFGPIWWLVSAILTVKESQRVSGGRATLAILPLPVFGVALLIGGYILMLSLAMSATAGARAGAISIAAPVPEVGDAAGAKRVATSISQESFKGGAGLLPDPLDLISQGIVAPSTLISTLGQTKPETWGISGFPLSDLPLITDEQMRDLRRRLAQIAPAPDDAGECRIADMVFTYRGPNVKMPGPEIWLVIMWPDPAVNSIEGPNEQIWVWARGRTVIGVTRAMFNAALSEQNGERAKSGLKPLRHPRDVRR